MIGAQKRLTQAAQALAQSAASQHIPQSITVQEALEYVDDPLALGWIAIAQTTQSPQQVLADLCAEMTEIDARAVICGSLVHPEVAGKLVAAALRERIARDLVREAEDLADRTEAA